VIISSNAPHMRPVDVEMISTDGCTRDVMAITKVRFLLIGRNKRDLLRSPWTKVLLSKENEKCLAMPPRPLDNAFHFLEDAPVALVSFVLWDSVRAPGERSLRFES
jgi:hypothetical protein